MGIFTIPGTIEAFFLVLALTTDAFLASFAYGTNKIKIPFASIIIINMVCSVILGVSLFLGGLVKGIIPTNATNLISFSILFFLGFIKLFEFTIKTWITKSNSKNPQISFHILDFRFFLQLYCDHTKADSDASKVLTPREALALALALSLDGIAAGFGAGLVRINYYEIVILSLLLGITGVLFGGIMGNKIASKWNLNMSWISGIILIILGILKLI